MPRSDHPQSEQNATRNARAGDAGPQASRGPNAGSRPDFERGERPQTDTAPGHEQRSFQTPTGAPSDDPPEDRYDPDFVQVTRGRQQGLGAGEIDLERQRDPHRPAPPPDEENRSDGD